MKKKIISTALGALPPLESLRSITIPDNFSKLIALDLRALFSGTSLDIYYTLSQFEERVVDVFRNRLPPDVLSTLDRVKRGEFDIIHIKKFPIDEYIPDGVDIEDRLAQKTRVSELAMLALSRLMGGRLWSNPAEHKGRPIHQISPVDGNAGFSSLSRDPQFFHVEIPYEAVPPKFLALLCLESDPNTRTTYLPITTLLTYIPPLLIDEMKKPDFMIRSGSSYKTGVVEGRFPLIDTSNGQFRLRLMQKFDRFEGMTPAARRCLYDLYTILNSDAVLREIQGVSLKKGDLLLFNNGYNTDGSQACGVLHGRDVVGKDGKLSPTRWLQRGYIMGPRDLTHLTSSHDDR